MRPTFMRSIFHNYERQQSVEKEMIIILNKDDMNVRRWRRKARRYNNVRVYQVPEKYTLGKCMNYGIRRAKYDIIAKFDDDDYYAPDFLKESIDAMKRKRAKIIGKHTSYVYFEKEKALMLLRKGNEKKYAGKVKGGTLVFRKSVWDRVKFSEKRVRGSDVSFMKHAKLKGYKIYSVSKHNYVCVRREDTSTHTQKTKAKKYMARCKLICHTENYIPFITKRV